MRGSVTRVLRIACLKVHLFKYEWSSFKSRATALPTEVCKNTRFCSHVLARALHPNRRARKLARTTCARTTATPYGAESDCAQNLASRARVGVRESKEENAAPRRAGPQPQHGCRMSERAARNGKT